MCAKSGNRFIFITTCPELHGFVRVESFPVVLPDLKVYLRMITINYLSRNFCFERFANQNFIEFASLAEDPGN